MKFKYQKLPRSSDPSVQYLGIPLVPVRLHRENEVTLPVYSLLDSGADNIIMPSVLAEVLGIQDITTGNLQSTLGVGGNTTDVYYFHDIKVELIGDPRQLPIPVGFVYNKEGKSVPPLLGRSFFEHYKSISFEQPKETIEIKI